MQEIAERTFLANSVKAQANGISVELREGIAAYLSDEQLISDDDVLALKQATKTTSHVSEQLRDIVTF